MSWSEELAVFRSRLGEFMHGAAFETRLRNSVDDEIQTALAQIAEIARLRLDALTTER